MEMMAQMKIMEANANNSSVNSNLLKQHTNKLFLIERHTTGMEYLTRQLTNEQTFIHHTLTPEIKFAEAVSLDVKNSIQINDLLKSINNPIDGKFLLCRTICPPCKMTALMTVVDDPEGKLAVKILLYNFVPTVSHLSHKDAYHYLPVGSMLCIMNPWFKTTVEGGVAVRCDNPSHVVQLNSSKFDNLFGGLTWKGQIPREFQRNELTAEKTSASDWKRKGNDQFSAKRFWESVVSYTNGIDCAPSKSKLWLDLLSNRSAAYHKLCNYKLALADAQSVLDVDETHIKCIVRRANALFGMGCYKDALSFLRNLSLDVSNANEKIIDDLVSKCHRLIVQSQTGDYPWKDILANELPDYCHDIAEYMGPVVVKESPNKGRGLFATEAIKAGQLILASRAFAISITKGREGPYLNSKSTKYWNTRSQTELVTKIAQILKDCPEKCTEFYSLYGGIEYNNTKSSQDTQVDVKRIGEICHYNSFGRGTFGGKGSENDVSGIWITPSFINHSCVDANSSWTRNGDFIFVRAFHDISDGEEISICYIPPFQNMIQKTLQKYGFTCDCRLCKRDRVDSPMIQALRSDLQSKLDKILAEMGMNKPDLDYRESAEVLTILNLLNESRSDAPELNIFFLEKVSKAAIMYYGNGLYLKCASMLENVYNTSERLAVMCDFTLSTIFNIIECYLKLGDEETATNWYDILKRKSALYYGCYDAVEGRYVDIMTFLEKSGLRHRGRLPRVTQNSMKKYITDTTKSKTSTLLVFFLFLFLIVLFLLFF